MTTGNGAGGGPRALLVAAPASGSGKTTVTLALLRAMGNAGRRVASAKAGPDYIDPRFHAAASGVNCVNLDPWAMRPDLIRALFADLVRDREIVLVEAMMGLFDGAADGSGSAADLAAMLGLPVVLVVDVAAQAQSVAALVQGFARFRADIAIAGVILNRVGSERHETMLRSSLAPTGVPVLGAVRRDRRLELASRHLGLVQAGEHPELERFLDDAATLVRTAVDLDGLIAAAAPVTAGAARPVPPLPPLGGRMAIARDEAFAFVYPHLLDGWRAAGAALGLFSPLADEAPPADADAVYLPGGYPELHAGQLAGNGRFLGGLRAAAARGAVVYGECGGYMVLGNGLVAADGSRHAMAGLLPVETSFAQRKLHLGYRRLRPRGALPWDRPLTAHEFHYASLVDEGPGDALFDAEDASGASLGAVGRIAGTVAGSFMHVVDLGRG